MNDKEVSKFLSYVLRHRPDTIGITLDDQGWTSIEDLLQRARAARKPISRDKLDQIVRESDKQRFAISDDGLRIRANQGHSVEVDLALPDREPPSELYHGTATRSLAAILHEGLQPQNRHAVHLSATVDVAHKVGSRHGKPVVLSVDAAAMARDGLRFQCSANGVWLTESVPPHYLAVLQVQEGSGS